MPKIMHASTTRHKEWHGPQRYIRIILHDTVQELRKAAQRYTPYQDWSDIDGCFHNPLYKEKFDPKTGKWSQTSSRHYAGIIRLSKDFISDQPVVHECVHAATYIYRDNCWPVVTLGRECTINEETFALITGDLAEQVYSAMHRGKVWG